MLGVDVIKLSLQ